MQPAIERADPGSAPAHPSAEARRRWCPPQRVQTCKSWVGSIRYWLDDRVRFRAGNPVRAGEANYIGFPDQVVRQKPPWAAITLLKMATGRDRALLPRTAAKGPRFSPPDKRARQIGLVAASSCVERDWAALQGIHGARTGSRPRVPHVGAGRPLFYSCCESDPRGSGRPAR
jgi:hypothetical protein